MGAIADMLKGRRIVNADDSGGKLMIETDHGDHVMVPMDPKRPAMTSTKFGAHPISNATH